MPQCGNCGKPVATSDVTCPHCDALLAAYASPTGSSAPPAYVPPAESTPTDIPTVDMEVQPPSETSVVTDPTEVAPEQVSTAPRPLFDTYLTVEEIAKAAESDHDDDVVTITNRKVATRTVEFDMPDYAQPPANAAPIPTLEDADAAVPLITHDTPLSATDRRMNKRATEKVDASNVPADKTSSESWLRTTGEPRPSRAKQRPNRQLRQDRPIIVAPESDTESVGETDSYLRKLHEESGYVPDTRAVSVPVDTGRPSPSERGRRGGITTAGEKSAASLSMNIGCITLYVIALVILWGTVVITAMTGNVSPILIFLAVIVTWGFKSIRKFIDRVNSL